jgi:CubicO group peptidase (beta-lactamase class C family)
MIMQLVEEGRLSLDTTVSEVLPSLRLGTEDVGAEVRVLHLLTHTSGIDGDIFTDTGRGACCVEHYVDKLAQAPSIYPVGASYSYCNSGFVLLGRIIEVLDGREWDASLRSRLVEPLGLTETVTLPEDAILHRAAVGHREHPHEGDPVSVWSLPRSLGPAGLITASAHDVLTFARLHLYGGVTGDGARLLCQDSVSSMQQPQFEIPSVDGHADAIGLGWRVSAWSGRRIIGHDGGTIGQLAYLRIDPEARVAACLLTNSSASEALCQRLFSEVFDAYVGVTVPVVPEPATEPLDLDLQRHVGRYERTSRRFDVSVRDRRLHVVSTMTGDRAALEDEGPEEYFLYPVDSGGHNFVCRVHDHEPWTPLSFDRLGDDAPYLYLGGRVTPRLETAPNPQAQ